VARLLPGLSDEEAHFAVHLKPVHEQVKLATLGAGGAIILLVQERIPAVEFRTRLTQVIATLERARAQLAAIDAPPLVAERWRAYLAAIDEARLAVEALRTRTSAAARKRIERATKRIAASHRRMQELGWTFWQPEYVPSGSEGSPANPHWREQSA
jgi:hypothetical protein